MKLLTKQDILSKDDLKKEKVEIPEWEGFVYISELSADARDEFEQFMIAERNKLQSKKNEYVHIRAGLAAATLVDEKGQRLFSFNDLIELGKKNGKALDRIFDVANKLNKIYGQEREDLEKNSETPQGDLSDGE